MEPIEALRAGEPEAIDWLVNSYADRLLRAATLILGDRYVAEDVVQESLMNAVLHLPHFRGDSSLYTWLYAIMIRRCRRLQGKAFWAKAVTLSPDFLGNLSFAEHTEKRLDVRSALRMLPFNYREVIVLFYFEELTIHEISRLLSIPEGTTKNRLYRARVKLKELLGEDR